MSMPEETGQAFEEFTPRRPFTSLFSTTRDVLLSPRRFFDAMPPNGQARGAVAYLLVCYLISAVLGILLGVFLLFPALGLAILFAPPSDPAQLGTTVGHVLLVALIGVLALVALYLVSGLLFLLWVPFQHAFVLLFARRSQRGIAATARLSCYAGGATILLSWLPIVGILAIPYSLYLLASGLKRVHRASNTRAVAAAFVPTAISFVLLGMGAFFAFERLADALPDTAFGVSEEESLPSDAVDYAVLEVGRPGHDRFKELRADSYAQAVPRARYAVEVLIATTVPPGQEPRGVVGRVKDSGHNGLFIGPAESTRNVGDEGDEINYIASVRESGSFVGGESGSLYQGFFFRGQRPYTVELKQVSQGWHTLYVRAYSAGDPTAKESVACFTVPYASVGSGDRLKLTVEPDEPFAELLMKVDRDADGEYEESWIPDATVYGSAANDNKASTTTARWEVMPNGETAVVLEHEDVGDSDAAAAGVGITYYYVNDDGPAIYTGPIPVDDDDTIEYLSLDRAGNIESSQETSVNRLMDEGGAQARRLPAAHPG